MPYSLELNVGGDDGSKWSVFRYTYISFQIGSAG